MSEAPWEKTNLMAGFSMALAEFPAVLEGFPMFPHCPHNAEIHQKAVDTHICPQGEELPSYQAEGLRLIIWAELPKLLREGE